MTDTKSNIKTTAGPQRVNGRWHSDVTRVTRAEYLRKEVDRQKRALARARKAAERSRRSRQADVDAKMEDHSRDAMSEDELIEAGVEENPGPGSRTSAPGNRRGKGKGAARRPRSTPQSTGRARSRATPADGASTSSAPVDLKEKGPALVSSDSGSGSESDAPPLVLRRPPRCRSPPPCPELGDSPEEAVMAGARPAEVVAIIEANEYLEKVEAVRTKYACDAQTARDLIELGGFRAVMRADMELERLQENLGMRIGLLAPVIAAAPPAPPALPPVRGAFLGTAQWRRRVICRNCPLYVFLAFSALLLYRLPKIELEAGADALENFTMSYVVPVFPSVANWALDREKAVKASAVDCLDRWYRNKVHTDPRQAARWSFQYRRIRNTLSETDTWEQHLARVKSSLRNAADSYFPVHASTIRSLGDVLYSVYAIVRCVVECILWLGKQVVSLPAYARHLRDTLLLVWQDPELVFDLWYGVSPDILAEVEQATERIPVVGRIRSTLRYLDTWLGWLHSWTHGWLTYILCLTLVVVEPWYLWFGSRVTLAEITVPNDVRLRTNAHVNLLERTIHLHHYTVGGIFNWLFGNQLYVVDHWVSVALSEHARGADDTLFLKNVHLKFLRTAELGIPDVDYARYKSDTVEYLRLILEEGFTLAPSRLTNVVGREVLEQ